MFADGFNTDTHGILLIFEVDKIAVGYLVRSKNLLRVIQMEILVQDTQIQQIRRWCLLVPDMFEHSILEVLNTRLIDDRRCIFP